MLRLISVAVAALLVPVALAPARAEEVDHPLYKSWARHKVGTQITTRTVSGIKGHEVETMTRQTLVELTDEKAVVQVAVTGSTAGTQGRSEPQDYEYKRKFPLLPGMKKEDIGKPSGRIASGEEPITVAGKPYKAQWYDSTAQTEAGPSSSRTWMSDEVPGKLLKSVLRVPSAGKVTTIELIEIKSP